MRTLTQPLNTLMLPKTSEVLKDAFSSLPSQAEMKFSGCQKEFTETAPVMFKRVQNSGSWGFSLHTARWNECSGDSRPHSNSALNVNPEAAEAFFFDIYLTARVLCADTEAFG